MCDAMCAGGQGACVTSFTDCCQFYDVVTRMCITTCPAGSINATDYTCGTYTSVFELNNNYYWLYSTDPCFSSPCQNQGACTALSSTSYKCYCSGIFVGINCESMYVFTL